MDKIKDISLEVVVPICPAGYRLATRKIVGGGITSIEGQEKKGIRMVMPKEPEQLEETKIKNVSSIWRDLVQLDNIRRVARESTLHCAVLKFCGKYGIPALDAVRSTFWGGGVPVDYIIFESRRMAKAIRSTDAGMVEPPETVMSELLKDDAFRIHIIKPDMFIKMDNTLLAAWFRLINTEVQPDRFCSYCKGINIARAKARFCSDYCRDRWHKQQVRSKRL